MHAPIRLNVVPSAYGKTPAAQEDLPWGELADEVELMAEVERAKKTDLLGFNFARLSRPYNVDASVTEHTALVIDVDRCNLAGLVSTVDAAGIAALIYSSPSDTQNGLYSS